MTETPVVIFYVLEQSRLRGRSSEVSCQLDSWLEHGGNSCGTSKVANALCLNCCETSFAV